MIFRDWFAPLAMFVGLCLTLAIGWLADYVPELRRRRRDRLIAQLELDIGHGGDTFETHLAFHSGKIDQATRERLVEMFLARHRPRPGGHIMQPTLPTEPHDPLLLKTLLDGLEQASPERAKQWLRSSEKGQKASPRVSIGTGLREGLQASRIQFSGTPVATDSTGYVLVDSVFPATNSSTTTAPSTIIHT